MSDAHGSRPLVIGSRGSKLALWQAHHVRDRLLALGVPTVSIEVIKTTGDRILDRALAEVGGKGLFTKEIEDALLEGRIDLAVHSMKDMPSRLPPGLVLAAVPEREDARDAWVLPVSASEAARRAEGDFGALLAALPQGAAVGTSSLRRAAQLTHQRPDVHIVALRGNVDTRLKKLDAGEDGLEAIILASAGLIRLGLEARISAKVPIETMLPAVGQGALAIETREGDGATRELLARLDHAETRWATRCERAFLARLEGNCHVPIAGHARVVGDELHFTGLVAEPRGHTLLIVSDELPVSQAEELGEEVADLLLERGADALVHGRSPGTP